MARIPQDKIDEIISSANIVNYVSRHVSLKKAGKNFKGLCPFHQEKTPSFTVSPEKQLFHCFGCGKGGNVLTFLMEIENISFWDALRGVAQDVGIRLPQPDTGGRPEDRSVHDHLYDANRYACDFFRSGLKPDQKNPATVYLSRRKLHRRTIDRFEMGYAPNAWDSLIRNIRRDQKTIGHFQELGLIQESEKNSRHYDRFRNRLMFPFHNLSGRIVGFGGRQLAEKDQPKYLNSPESPVYKKGEILYGLYQAVESIRKYKSCILVEGYFDLLRLVDSGIENVVASSGTAMTATQARLIKRYTDRVYIAYDSDSAGIAAALRNSRIMEKEKLSVSLIMIPEPHDPDSFVQDYGREKFTDLIGQAVNPVDYQLTEFKRNHPDPSADTIQTLSEDMLSYLVELPDAVKTGFYLHRISEKLEIAETLLIERFNQLKRKPVFRETAKESAVEKKNFRRGEWRAEESIIALLLSGAEQLINQVLDHLSASDFMNEDLRLLFENISLQWEEMGQIDTAKLGTPGESRSAGPLLAELQVRELHQPEKLAADCIYRIRKKSLDLRFNEIKSLMNEERHSDKSVLHYMKELTEIRRKLSEIEEEHLRFSQTKL